MFDLNPVVVVPYELWCPFRVSHLVSIVRGNTRNAEYFEARGLDLLGPSGAGDLKR